MILILWCRALLIESLQVDWVRVLFFIDLLAVEVQLRKTRASLPIAAPSGFRST